MYRITGVFLGLAFGIFMFSSAPAGAIDLPDAVTAPNGVYCEINDVRVFARSAEDCAKANGAVTHTVTTKVEPVGNPDQEPEIERTKDKEPEAP